MLGKIIKALWNRREKKRKKRAKKRMRRFIRKFFGSLALIALAFGGTYAAFTNRAAIRDALLAKLPFGKKPA